MSDNAEQKVDEMIKYAEDAMNTAKTAMNDAEKEMNILKTEMDTAKTIMDTAKTEMNAMVNWRGALNDPSQKSAYDEKKENYETNKKEYETKKKDIEMKKKDIEMKKKEYNEKNKIFLDLKAKRRTSKDDQELLDSLDRDELQKLKNPMTSNFSAMTGSVLPGFKPSSTPPPQNQSIENTQQPSEAKPLTWPGKKITVTFIQDANKQCFIKDYNMCEIEKEDLPFNADVLNQRLVIDSNAQPVTENIQNVTKNVVVSKECVAPAAQSNGNNNNQSGGYDAMKRSRSVGTKRKTIRQAKRHARRSRRYQPSRRSRPSRLSL